MNNKTAEKNTVALVSIGAKEWVETKIKIPASRLPVDSDLIKHIIDSLHNKRAGEIRFVTMKFEAEEDVIELPE